MSRPPIDPWREYHERLAARRATAARCGRRDDRLSLARGLVFLAGLLVLAAAAGLGAPSPWWLVPMAAAFIGLVMFHAVVCRRLKRAQAAVALYETALDRLGERWAGAGADGARYADAEHPYANDLDLFGAGSLFQLVSRARTRLGEDALAGWLSTPAELPAVKQRQAAVDELRHRIDLRETLALLDAEVYDDFDQSALRNWAAQVPRPVAPSRRALSIVLSVLVVGTLGVWLSGGRVAWLMAALTLQAVNMFTFRRELREAGRRLDQAAAGLAILAQVLEVFESGRFDSPLLAALRARLVTVGRPPSAHVSRLRSLLQSLDNCLRNQFFAPVAFVLALPVHLVHALERWKAAVAGHIPDWLEAVGDFEALVSLSGYAFEHPDDPNPELAADGPLFEGVAIGHPLLKAADCVRNDVKLGPDCRLLLVSGSNMSGKSTLLRTVGINTVLALAGGPVRATALRLSRLQVGTEMRVADSLQNGRSLFYSVVERLKRIVDLAGRNPPLLFLLDEILQGTNSRDRRQGAEVVIRTLVSAGAIGLVTTHDLALTEIVESLGPAAVNVHFEDQLLDGRMTFDFRLRPGVVERTNAIELMRMLGLVVDYSQKNFCTNSTTSPNSA